MTSNSSPVFDADQHYYESIDAFTRHLDPAWGPRSVQIADIDGRVHFVLAGKVSTAISNPTFDPIVKPGAMMEFFRGNPKGLTIADCLAQREPIPDFYRNPDARIKQMDRQNVQAAWLLPTIGMAYEEGMQFDPEAAGVAFKAFNRWLHDDWGFNYQDRLFSAPYLAMGDRDACIKEVEWGLSKGAKLFVVRPSGIYTEGGWRSPGDEWFDPIWARIEEAGVPVIPHIGEVGGFGLDRYVEYRTGVIRGNPSPLQVIIGHERPIANYMAALMAGKVFERFPRLRIASIENGADFLPLLLAGLRRAHFQRPGHFKEDPVALFKEHVWVAPFWEDSMEQAVSLIGADRVLFGSDWPHPEGMVEPRDFQKLVDEIGDPIAERKIMYENVVLLTGVRP